MLKIFNTATGTKEAFKPIRDDYVSMYTCGMTVYSYTHIGHLKSYLTSDIVVRYLRYLGYKVRQVMNVTDVGHHLSDEDIGEDKLEMKAKAENSSPWQIARHYESIFFAALDQMHITRPSIIARASEHIDEMIALIRILDEKGYVYASSIGQIFDTSKFPRYADFAHLDIHNQMAGYRIAQEDDRRAPTDFALWITNKPNHIMKWDSPWGVGYPGWHVECSAMIRKYLGANIDIHTGGVDHIKVHHTNEVAQSEAAYGGRLANYWVHTAFLNTKGVKMSKSLGNLFTLQDLARLGYSPMALRYTLLKSDYRKQFDFSWEALYNAQNELVKIWEYLSDIDVSQGNGQVLSKYKEAFMAAMDDDFNTAKAISVMWELLHSSESDSDKMATVLDFDSIFGLGLENSIYELNLLEDLQGKDQAVKQAARLKLSDRAAARKAKDYATADQIRHDIEKAGYSVVDTAYGSHLKITNYGTIPMNQEEG